MQNKVYEIVTDRIVKMLERDVVPWRKTWNEQQSIECTYGQFNYSKKGLRAYRGINPFLLVGRYSSPYWCTYRQAEELGGHVRQGEKGSIVVFWRRDEKDTGKKDVHGKPITEKHFILRYYTVFNLEQCDGITPPTQETIEKVQKPITSCQALLDAMREHPRMITDIKAYYSPSGDYIGCPDLQAFESSEAYYSTLYHEIAHWTGHSSRLDREGTKSPMFGSETYSKEELIAEMSAAFLCDLTGISQKTLDNSAAYIASWLKALKNDKTMVLKAASAAQKACDYITNNTSEPIETVEPIKVVA